MTVDGVQPTCHRCQKRLIRLWLQPYLQCSAGLQAWPSHALPQLLLLLLQRLQQLPHESTNNTLLLTIAASVCLQVLSATVLMPVFLDFCTFHSGVEISTSGECKTKKCVKQHLQVVAAPQV